MREIMESLKDPEVVARLTQEPKAEVKEDRALQEKRALANKQPRRTKVYVAVNRAVHQMRHTGRRRGR